jgi:selenocysteine-specific elongation factor
MTSVVIGTAGHIDHGKSALVKALTGTDPDRLKEEQARGITIDLGFAHLETPGVTLAFVDVPGHERFVRTMLAGAGGIDAVLLVVAADESVMPQTREHFDICRLLGIERGVIALTKADLVDRDTIDLVSLEVRDLVSNSFLADAPLIPVSARTGDGLPALTDALAAIAGASPRLGREGVVRLPVDRAFTVKGFGSVVTGTLVSGRVSEGDELVALPEERPVRVRGVQVHGRQAGHAIAPGRVALNLGSIELAHLTRGVTLASPDSLCVTRRVDVHLELLKSARPLRHGARVRMHHGTSEVLGRVSICATRRDPSDRATRRNPSDPWRRASAGELGVVVAAGAEAFVRVRLERPAVLTRNDRVVFRAYSPPVTIGGGVVVDPDPSASGVRRVDALDRFMALADPSGWIGVWLRESGGTGLNLETLIRRGGLGPAAAKSALDGLIASGQAIVAGGLALSEVERVFQRSIAARLEHATEETLSAFHAEQPLEAGMPREALRDKVAARVAPELFDTVLASLEARGAVRGTDRVARSDHRPSISPDDGRLRDAVLSALRAGGLRPPDIAELATTANAPVADVQALVQRLVREKKLIKLDTLVMHPDALSVLKQEVRALAGPGQPASAVTVDVSTFKERYGLSRKYAIPLLEWLDRERVTRREGDRRIVISNR